MEEIKFESYLVQNTDTAKTAIQKINANGFGLVFVVDANEKLLGVITDGDIRRTLLKYSSAENLTVKDVMTINPKTVQASDLAAKALAIMEKLNVKSKASRAVGMVAGIITTGVVGGSVIANAIGNKIINPIFGNKPEKGLYAERKPEALDIGLHVDDIATVAVMSGLKWIEPALPIMYSISGYRAGIGYRNVKKCNKKNNI